MSTQTLTLYFPHAYEKFCFINTMAFKDGYVKWSIHDENKRNYLTQIFVDLNDRTIVKSGDGSVYSNDTIGFDGTKCKPLPKKPPPKPNCTPPYKNSDCNYISTIAEYIPGIGDCVAGPGGVPVEVDSCYNNIYYESIYQQYSFSLNASNGCRGGNEGYKIASYKTIPITKPINEAIQAGKSISSYFTEVPDGVYADTFGGACCGCVQPPHCASQPWC